MTDFTFGGNLTVKEDLIIGQPENFNAQPSGQLRVKTLLGDVNVTGNVIGNITGNVIGDLTGNITLSGQQNSINDIGNGLAINNNVLQITASAATTGWYFQTTITQQPSPTNNTLWNVGSVYYRASPSNYFFWKTTGFFNAVGLINGTTESDNLFYDMGYGFSAADPDSFGFTLISNVAEVYEQNILPDYNSVVETNGTLYTGPEVEDLIISQPGSTNYLNGRYGINQPSPQSKYILDINGNTGIIGDLDVSGELEVGGSCKITNELTTMGNTKVILQPENSLIIEHANSNFDGGVVDLEFSKTDTGLRPGIGWYNTDDYKSVEGSGEAPIIYYVTVEDDGSGNKYKIDNVYDKILNLDVGKVYKFDQSDSSNDGHPLRLSSIIDGIHATGGTEYVTCVLINGTPGQAGAYTQITISEGAPTLYYYCTNHSGMGGLGQLNISGGSNNAPVIYYVTVENDGSGNKYKIDNVFSKSLNFIVGKVYKFDQSDTSNDGHPLRLSSIIDGIHANGGTEYVTDVITNRTSGQAGAYTQITVSKNTPILYYYCTNHSGMGGQGQLNILGSGERGGTRGLQFFYSKTGTDDPAFPTGKYVGMALNYSGLNINNRLKINQPSSKPESQQPEYYLDVVGDTRLSGELSVSGDTTISGKIGIGQSTLQPEYTLKINGNTGITGDLEVSGDTTISGKIGIGQSTLQPEYIIYINGNTGIAGDLEVTGNISGNITGNVTGNAVSATRLASSVNIGGVEFDGSQNINLPGVNSAGNQNTSGNAATATKIASINNSDIVQLDQPQTLTNKTLTSPTITGTGTIAGTFIGDLTGDVTGNADTATKIANINNSDIVQLDQPQTLTNKTLTSPTITGTGTIAGTFTGDLNGNVTGNLTGTVNTQTQNSIETMTGLTAVGTSGNTLTFSSPIIASEGISVSASGQPVSVSASGLFVSGGNIECNSSIIASVGFSGNLTGNVTGNVYASNGTSEVLHSGTNGSDATFTGDVTGDVTGDLTGNITGNTNIGGNITMADGKNITVSAGGKFIGPLQGNVTGSAATLTTARTIGGVSFDGSDNINLPGVNQPGTQDTSGNAGSVTNGVYTISNQIIAGTKTFSSTISGDIDGNADKIKSTGIPSNSSSEGSPGQIRYDSDYIYICVSSGSWKRIAFDSNSW